MANTTVGINGVSRPNCVEVVGSFMPLIPFKCTPAATTTSETITFSQLKTIVGVVLLPLGASGVTAFGDANGALGPLVTWSGNVLTIADGTDYDLDQTSSIIYGIVWSIPYL